MQKYNAYQVEVVKKLHWLSDYIMSEFDENSNNYYFKNHNRLYYEQLGKNIISKLPKAKVKRDVHILTNAIYMDNWLSKQKNFSELISSDPFIPKKIRKEVSKFYWDRCFELSNICHNEMEKFCKDVYNLGNRYNKEKGYVSCKLEEIPSFLLHSKERNSKFSTEKSLLKINNIRTMIEKYLLSL